jgi:hypothetical protein
LEQLSASYFESPHEIDEAIDNLSAQIVYAYPYDAMSWAGLGNVLISKELDSLRLHVLILSNSFEINTLQRPAQDFAS